MNVYRIDGQTGKATIVAEGMLGPNGLCFSPDEKILYIVESRGVPTRKILAYDVAASGDKISNKRVLIDAGPGTPDGMRCDIDGNLWCGWGMGDPELDGVVVFAPDGVLIGRIALPERCANVCFGGLEAQPAVHGREPVDLRALCEHARRARGDSIPHRRRCERSEATQRPRKSGLLRRGACHRARIRATRWLLA